MKKLALMTAVAAIALTPAAFAKSRTTTEASAPGHSYTVIEREMHNDTVRVGTATYRTTYKKQIDAEGNIDYTGRYNLINTDNDLLVENETAYLVTPRGSRFYAPQSAFTTAQGYTFYIESGKVLRMESPPEIVYVDTDDLTR